MGLFGKSRKELLEWQNMIIATPINRLVMTEVQLKKASYQSAENSMRIMNDSARICEKTKKPDVFFSRYALLLEHVKQLVKLSKYVKFSGTTPQAVLRQAIEERPIAIRELIDRCIEDAEALKTDSARRKRYSKILMDFSEYRNEMDEDNWNYLESICGSK